jgi:hypothetical protein
MTETTTGLVERIRELTDENGHRFKVSVFHAPWCQNVIDGGHCNCSPIASGIRPLKEKPE